MICNLQLVRIDYKYGAGIKNRGICDKFKHTKNFIYVLSCYENLYTLNKGYMYLSYYFIDETYTERGFLLMNSDKLRQSVSVNYYDIDNVFLIYYDDRVNEIVCYTCGLFNILKVYNVII